MKFLLSTLILISISACSTGSSDDSQDGFMVPRTPEQAAKAKFEDVHEVMELTDETLDPLFQGKWDGTDENRKQLAFHADMLALGFGWMQTTLKPKDVESDFSTLSQDTAVFMQQLAAAAKKDSESVKALFADPRSVGKNYCGRCHDKYRDD